MARLRRSKLPIASGLTFAFGTAVALTFAALAAAVIQEKAFYAAMQHYNDELFPSVLSTQSMQSHLAAIGRAESMYVASSSSAEMKDLENGIFQERQLLQTDLQQCETLAGDTQGHEDCEQISSRASAYLVLEEKVLALSRDRAVPGQHEAAVGLLVGASSEALNASSGAVQARINHIKAMAANVAGQSENLYRHGLYWVIGIGCLALFSAAAAVIRIAASFSRPLARAVQLAEQVARGDLTGHVDPTEIQSAEVHFLFVAFDRMSSQLSHLISEVQSSAQAVDGTAIEIAQSSNDLSLRTQQQAANLEQTAASMEQITALGKNNSSNAATADRLAQEARELAESGGSVVAEAVSAMSTISEGSAKISSIIGVIDEIAFQTNLLALNAAVEAARAGDQGRGFAVVASEVRALAQRSAEAARQINVLISDSANKVRVGSDLVDRSGQALSKILHSVRQMTGLIKQIAAASFEQAQGVQRINEVILGLDGATQHTAALVEQGSNASRSLQDQATRLSKIASSFVLKPFVDSPVLASGKPASSSESMSWQGRRSVSVPAPAVIAVFESESRLPSKEATGRLA